MIIDKLKLSASELQQIQQAIRVLENKNNNDSLKIVSEVKDFEDKVYKLKSCNCEQVFSNPPGYLNESSIVKKVVAGISD